MNLNDTVLIPTVMNAAGAQITRWVITDTNKETMKLSFDAGPGKKPYSLRVPIREIGKNGETHPLYMYTNEVMLARPTLARRFHECRYSSA